MGSGTVFCAGRQNTWHPRCVHRVSKAFIRPPELTRTNFRPAKFLYVLLEPVGMSPMDAARMFKTGGRLCLPNRYRRP